MNPASVGQCVQPAFHAPNAKKKMNASSAPPYTSPTADASPACDSGNADNATASANAVFWKTLSMPIVTHSGLSRWKMAREAQVVITNPTGTGIDTAAHHWPLLFQTLAEWSSLDAFANNDKTMRPAPANEPTRFTAPLPVRSSFAARYNPQGTASTTTATDAAMLHQSSVRCMPPRRDRTARNAGIKGTLTNVDAVVTATDSARSALHNEHHNPENPPDGDAVTSSSVIRVTLENGATRNARYPRNGMTR
mmetsp:Transcript_968/g.2933  ORF Transcript_968/g.2933 Transcript_968/m.2933 type:complete len:251 (+) Transcript_968:310-1062(+)